MLSGTEKFSEEAAHLYLNLKHNLVIKTYLIQQRTQNQKPLGVNLGTLFYHLEFLRKVGRTGGNE